MFMQIYDSFRDPFQVVGKYYHSLHVTCIMTDTLLRFYNYSEFLLMGLIVKFNRRKIDSLLLVSTYLPLYLYYN